MKIKTDSSHKSFSVKNIKNNKVKRLAIKIGTIILIAGIMFTMSGCQKTNKDMMKHYQDLNKEVIELYQEGKLPSETAMETLNLKFAPIDEHFISQLPNGITSMYLEDDAFLTDLSILPSVCPHIETLYIKNCYSITNYDFIKDLKNLKTFKIGAGHIGITSELIAYLEVNNIEHNLTKKDVELNNKVESIVNSIITEDMTDEEKAQQIALYITNNLEYDKQALSNDDLCADYNADPLRYALEGKGVCVNFAVLTNALFEKAGIDSNVVKDIEHAWNLVCIEDKYYYIDTTNIDQIPVISNLLLKHFNIGFNYKNDPYATGITAMSDIDELMTATPERVIKLINEANDKKSFIEKYGSNLYVDLIAAVGVLIGLKVLIKASKNKQR